MMKNLLMNLPEDVFINNILLSKVLPIQSLLSLRCVCKYLRNLINSPAFINMHLHHSTSHDQLSNELVLIEFSTTYYPFYVLSFLKLNDGDDPCRPEVVTLDYPNKSLEIWGSCNGLLCITITEEYDRNIVFLWNPSTKEYKHLPPPLPLTDIPIGITKQVRIASRVGSITYGFGYDRFIDDYKIVRCIHVHHIPSFTEFQVYTLGTNTWRKISSDNNPYKSYYVKPSLEYKSIVFVNGALHWIMLKSLNRRSDTVIVSLDIEKEVFQEIQKPLISKLDYDFSSKIQVLRGCLCLFDKFDNSGNIDYGFNVWMMMDYGVKESWTNLFKIVHKEVPRYIPNTGPLVYRLLRFCENGEILIGAYDILFAYDPIKNKGRRVELNKSASIGKHVYQSQIYIESLVSVNSGVYKGVKGEFDPRRIE